MKRIAMAVAVGAVLMSPASAADLAYKRVPVENPIQNWLGFYIGAAAGWGTVDASADYGPLDIGSGSADGFVGGGFAGYNLPIGNVVIGIDADVFGGDLSKTRSYSIQGTPVYTEVGLNYVGTVRARVGYAFGTVLPYVTAGLAYGETYADAATAGTSVRQSNDRTGWTFGVGADFAFAPHWFARIDYKYFDFGTKNYYVFGDAYGVDVDGQLITFGVGLKF